ncbi:sensor histidine kinase [Vibrio variabilis]|uniref:histidine kinase n=1 Tax=Vibrio variabilis TaxID=990271 RepID=A0ABQ0JAJ9_9VIBR|nr:sensor histidine kinase [Vibrio variabilis]
MQLVTSLSERIESLAGNLQQLSRSLHPKILHDLGFYSAIAAESRRIESLKPITIHLIVDSQLADKLTDSIQLHLYRITQEALGNIVKHATSVETVLISLNDDGEDIVYSIRDDGRGCDSTQKAGLGLTSIEERALQCGGVAKYVTAPGEGFEVEIRLPYSAFTRKQP